MEKYITNNDRRPSRPGFYRVIYSDGNTGVEHFDGKMWQVQYAYPVDRWLEENPAPADPLSPEEWMEQNMFSYPSGPEQWENAMQEYAAYVRDEALRKAAGYVEKFMAETKYRKKYAGTYAANEILKIT